MPVLILGGTSDARRVAELLPGSISSLAGRVRQPMLPAGEVRIGGFGGVAGLAAYLRSAGITAVVDATHPFAAQMTAHAAQACALTGVPLVVLRRPGWSGAFTRVPSFAVAADVLPSLGSRVFLTTGRQDLAVFAGSDLWFLVRSVDPPAPPTPRRMVSVLDRGPFTVEGETALMRAHAIDVLVTKDSGGPTGAKLQAAQSLGIPVLMIDRPPLPPGVEAVDTPAAAADWTAHRTMEP
ncbi:cobalt-precorrin-6A reductase [Pseudonocardia sp. WMMC193]|uniref:cobalt-precorrin-6A reductase n=1 Tax=Pseudonocardia sp. WMMC193 TaxID=2911965 RepID=UPI001F016401|nr:cobalt-precorrin-6A reductase [Pseudonocardia sp. WMMC193]MCF7549731.1 cobalt-precorrin-6A reductase [Pseudonocardia sp. WMMC193]